MNMTKSQVCALIIVLTGLSFHGRLFASQNEHDCAMQDYPGLFSDYIRTDSAINDKWTPDKPCSEPSWNILKEQKRSGYRGYAASGTPVIMMAGYMDTDLSWRNGGVFKMLAWVWDPDDDVVSVEIFFDGTPTGVFLKDDGISGDFEAGDSLYGITVEIPAQTLIPGNYILELRARDSLDNISDLWPYLTIHD